MPPIHKSWATTSAQTKAAFLAAIIDHVAHPVFVKDREFRFVLVNPAMCRLVNLSADQLLGKTDHDFFAKEEADFFRQKDAEVFRSSQEASIAEEPFTDSHGDRHILTTRKMPLRDDGGEVTHLVGIIYDITHLKAVNEELDRRVQERTAELRTAQAELMRKERLAVLGQLAGGLAHQIRNPLGAIVNTAALLRRSLGSSPTPEAMSALSMLHEEAWRANRIISDLIDYARVRPPTRARVDAQGLLEQAVASQELGPRIQVRWELGPVPLCVGIDNSQALAALGNLIRNAAESMPGGGTLTVGAQPAGSLVRLTIRDTGQGIPDDVRHRLFQPLVTGKEFGLGLGLATARALIENQGGSIRVVHSDAQGSVFEVDLPACDESDQPGKPSVGAGTGQL